MPAPADPQRQARLDRIAEIAAVVLVIVMTIQILYSLFAPSLFELAHLPSPSSVDLGLFGVEMGGLLAILNRGAVIRLVGTRRL
ncbi:MAG TPA: hypothetical protein VMH41_16835 [Mycobacteriales bacterium]|nr:hypothetical protein [Mycobacteriales bacterium]